MSRDAEVGPLHERQGGQAVHRRGTSRDEDLVEERKRASSDKAEGESDGLAKIAEMPEPDRVMAARLHAIIKASTPAL